jgi:hypothetical protein
MEALVVELRSLLLYEPEASGQGSDLKTEDLLILKWRAPHDHVRGNSESALRLFVSSRLSSYPIWLVS